MTVPLTSRRVIPAAEMGLVTDAVALVEAARATRESADGFIRRAVETGLAEGYAAGLAQTRKALLDRVAEAAERAEAALQALEEPIVVLVVEAVEKIIGELPHRDRIAALIGRAISELNYPGPIKLHVPSEGAEGLKADAERLDPRLAVVVDPLLKEDELVLEVLGERTHIGFQDQMAHFRERMMRG